MTTTSMPTARVALFPWKLHDHINACVRSFIIRYRQYLPQAIEIKSDNALVSFQSTVDAVDQTPNKLHLLIDEYDNFANEVMAAQLGGKDRYATLVHGEGMTQENTKFP